MMSSKEAAPSADKGSADVIFGGGSVLNRQARESQPLLKPQLLELASDIEIPEPTVGTLNGTTLRAQSAASSGSGIPETPWNSTSLWSNATVNDSLVLSSELSTLSMHGGRLSDLLDDSTQNIERARSAAQPGSRASRVLQLRSTYNEMRGSYSSGLQKPAQEGLLQRRRLARKRRRRQDGVREQGHLRDKKLSLKATTKLNPVLRPAPRTRAELLERYTMKTRSNHLSPMAEIMSKRQDRHGVASSSTSYPAGFQHLASKSSASSTAPKVPSTIAVNALLSKYVRIYQGTKASGNQVPSFKDTVVRNRPRNLSPLPMTDGKPIHADGDEQRLSKRGEGGRGGGNRRQLTGSITRKRKPIKLPRSQSETKLERTPGLTSVQRKKKQLHRSTSFASTGSHCTLPMGDGDDGGQAPANVISLVFLDNKHIGLKDIHDYMSSGSRKGTKRRNVRDKARHKGSMLNLHLQASGGKAYTTSERVQQAGAQRSKNDKESAARERERTRSRGISDPRPWQVPPAGFSGFDRGSSKKMNIVDLKRGRRGSQNSQSREGNSRLDGKRELGPEIVENFEKSTPLPAASEPAIKRVTWDLDIEQKMGAKRKKAKPVEHGRASPILIDGW